MPGAIDRGASGNNNAARFMRLDKATIERRHAL